MRTLKLANRKFGLLTPVRRCGHRGKQVLWFCRCDCGKTHKLVTRALTSGNTKSCGCLRRRTGKNNPTTIHGHCPKKGLRSPEWRAYHNAKQRCINPHNISYKYYGGRGIQFKYVSFMEFLIDVGKRPSSDYTLDRTDNNGHYELGNCRWATHVTQVLNRRIKKLTDFSDQEIRQEFLRRNL